MKIYLEIYNTSIYNNFNNYTNDIYVILTYMFFFYFKIKYDKINMVIVWKEYTIFMTL